MQKVNDTCPNCGRKEKASEYYIANKDILKEKARNKYKNLSEEEKEARKKKKEKNREK